MPQYDNRVDAYIEKMQPFAKEILSHIRKVVHDASPLIEETMKWGFPHFIYKDNVCSMAGFKSHCAFGFWKATLMDDPYKIFGDQADAMGSIGRIGSLADLPSDKILTEYVLAAIKLNEEGKKLKKTATPPKPEIPIPDYFTSELNQNPLAKQTFEKFSPSARREYLEWVTTAKTEATRLKRMSTTIEWLTQGKQLNWRYQK